MAKRKIIKIDINKCNGCGKCIPNCPEGALQLIDGKARLISDLFCDGLGACIGHCPEGAITFEEREAEAYDERQVMENIVKQGENVVKAHLEHLKDHNETKLFEIAISVLKEKGMEVPKFGKEEKTFSGCPGAKMMNFSDDNKGTDGREEEGQRKSQLRQWPVQLHLVRPEASYFQKSDLLVAADCTAFSLADFHKDYLKDKSLIIACPKLDHDQEIYIEKLKSLIDDAEVNTITVMTMEVPCCGGLLFMVKKAKEEAKREVPVKHIVVGIQGDILKEEWIK